jgi:succinate-acetate transporter protein
VTTTDMPRSTAESATTPPVVIADPGPLGLAAFALTTFILSTANAGIINAGVESIVFSSALFYGGAVQVLAGMWEYRKGNTFGATAFGSYGGFWLAFWGLGHFFVPGKDVTTGDINQAVGVFLLAWTIFTAYMLIASVGTSNAVFVVFALLTVTFVLLTAGKFADSTTLTHLGGWLGLATALGAWYVSFAAVTNETWKRKIIPVGPRG